MCPLPNTIARTLGFLGVLSPFLRLLGLSSARRGMLALVNSNIGITPYLFMLPFLKFQKIVVRNSREKNQLGIRINAHLIGGGGSDQSSR